MIYNWKGFFTLIRREVSRARRVIGQAIIAPLITATLYIFVFGFVVGSKIQLIEGITYISFVFPGIFAMNLIMAVFSATSFSMYFMKFQKTIEDVLTLPLSYAEIVLSLIISGIVRAFAITLALSFVAVMFGVNSIMHPFYLLFFVLLISLFFGFLGIIAGIWADNSFEKFGLVTNFILTPLTFLGGAFYSASMLPEKIRFIVHANPVFYAVDSLRFSLTGYHESSLLMSTGVLGGLALLSMLGCVYIFKTGWKLRA